MTKIIDKWIDGDAEVYITRSARPETELEDVCVVVSLNARDGQISIYCHCLLGREARPCEAKREELYHAAIEAEGDKGDLAYTLLQHETALRLYWRGMGVREVAQTVSVPQKVVSRWAREDKRKWNAVEPSFTKPRRPKD